MPNIYSGSIEVTGAPTTLEKVLLADFGKAKQLTRTMTARTVAGTPIYMSPEMRCAHAEL